MLRQNTIRKALRTAERTVAQRVAADVHKAMAASNAKASKLRVPKAVQTQDLNSELEKARSTVQARVAADLHKALKHTAATEVKAVKKATVTQLSRHAGTDT